MDIYTAYGVTNEDCKDSTIKWVKLSDHESSLDASLKHQLKLSECVIKQDKEIREIKKDLQEMLSCYIHDDKKRIGELAIKNALLWGG